VLAQALGERLCRNVLVLIDLVGEKKLDRGGCPGSENRDATMIAETLERRGFSAK